MGPAARPLRCLQAGFMFSPRKQRGEVSNTSIPLQHTYRELCCSGHALLPQTLTLFETNASDDLLPIVLFCNRHPIMHDADVDYDDEVCGGNDEDGD